MTKTLRVLHVEDQERDARLLTLHLSRAGYELTAKRVDTAAAMRAALESQEWDVILCDYSMPQFSALAALALMKEMNLDIPLIIISGTIGEAAAVEAMRSGAQDYLMKDNLVRLAPSIDRELKEAQNRRARRQAEKALHETNRTLQTFIQASPLAIVALDMERKVKLWNPAAERLFGWSESEVMGKMLPTIPEEDLPGQLQLRKQFLEHGTPALFNLEGRRLRKDGSVIDVSASIAPLYDPGGEVSGTIGIISDITERKRAEEQLRLQSAALESAANGILITDAQGKILWVNPAFTQSSGYSPDDVVGQNPRLLKSEKQDQSFYQEMWNTILSGKVWRNTIINRRKDGTLFYEDLTITPIRNREGTITRFVGIQHDITERKLAEEAHKASELRYRRLFESAKDGILIVDADTGKIVDANPYMMETLGYSYEELIGRELWEIGVFKNIAAARDSFEALRDKSYVRYEDLPFETRSGLVVEGEFVSNVFMVGESKVMQCNIRDLSERKRAERVLAETNRKLETTLDELSATTQQLWQASKLATMGELSASIAHELNNPLATVSLRVENLLMPMKGGDPQRHSLEIIAQEVDRMAGLIDNLLQFSRRSHRQISTLDAREEIANSVDFVHYHLRSRKIEVIREFADSLPSIQGDRQQLRQVFLNLLTNASDAMPAGGQLFVRAEPTALEGEAAVAIEFADTGEGITPVNLEKIWEPFFTTKPAGKGTGLGLAICRRIVEEHGGTIEIESPSEGGTTVRVIVPATADGAPADL